MMASAFTLPADEQHERHAALMLHAMHGADRDWLMKRLPSKERDVLNRMLRELVDLGIAPDQSILQDALVGEAGRWATNPMGSAAEPIQTSVVVGMSDEDFLKHITDQDVAVLARAWSHEPAQLVAQCLHVRPWAWKEGALKRLSAAQRQRIERALFAEAEEGALSGARAKALLKVMRSRCEAGRSHGMTTGAPQGGQAPRRATGMVHRMMRSLKGGVS